VISLACERTKIERASSQNKNCASKRQTLRGKGLLENFRLFFFHVPQSDDRQSKIRVDGFYVLFYWLGMQKYTLYVAYPVRLRFATKISIKLHS